MRLKSLLPVSFLSLVGLFILLFQNCSPFKVEPGLADTSGQQSSTSSPPTNSESSLPEASLPPVTNAPRTGSVIPSFIDLTKAALIDEQTPNCTEPINQGLKCLNTSVVTSEGLSYKVRIKWSRPNVDSKGSVFIAIGGSGGADTQIRDNPPSKFFIDKLTNVDQLRVIDVEFVDKPINSNYWGGYFVHAGGYKSASLAFAEVVKLIVDKQIVRGKFLNYLGGSNASMVAAYSMSYFGTDQYFDRVVLQMGPFLANLKSSCAQNSSDSFYKNKPDQQTTVLQLLGSWRFGNPNQSVCSDLTNDRMSTLGPVLSFPYTHVHTIIGALETDYGFGQFMLNSNEVWFNSISAKTKLRIVRPEMAHNNSFKDMRRFLKLSPSEIPTDDPDYIDKTGEFCNGSVVVQFNCRAGAQILPPTDDLSIKWSDQGGGCFHLATTRACSL
jgi:hypothetical protein